MANKNRIIKKNKILPSDFLSPNTLIIIKFCYCINIL